MSKMSNGDGLTLLATILMYMVMGMVLGAALYRAGHPTDGYIADCAIGQDETLRETKGVASFEVTFKDGEYQTVTCLNEKSEASE